jgi:hypothetical protein
MRVRGDAAALASLPYQAVSLEDGGSRAVGRPGLVGLQDTEAIHDLLGSEALVRELHLHDALGDLGCRRVRVSMGPA